MPAVHRLQTEGHAAQLKEVLQVLREAPDGRSGPLSPVAAGALLLQLRLWQGLPPYAARAAAALEQREDVLPGYLSQVSSGMRSG